MTELSKAFAVVQAGAWMEGYWAAHGDERGSGTPCIVSLPDHVWRSPNPYVPEEMALVTDEHRAEHAAELRRYAEIEQAIHRTY